MGQKKTRAETKRMYLNVWDSCTIAELAQTRSIRLFGNANVGMLAYTNLQIPGQLANSAGAGISRMYVRTDLCEPDLGEARDVIFDALIDGRRDDAMALLLAGLSMADVQVMRAYRAWAARAFCTLSFGDGKTMATLDVSSLARRTVPFQIGEPTAWELLERQNFMVHIETHDNAIEDLARAIATHRPGRPEPRVWVHLEGWSDRYVQ